MMKKATLLLLSILLICICAPPESSAATASLGPNLKLIGVEPVWARGITGKGIVVALLDSGVDMTHPEFEARWRGGSNSWFDPYDEHPEGPIDASGHGTQMLGVILGGAESGTSLGVAPDAQWIAARVFNDRGRATTQAIHQALKWVLDPDDNPATNDAPQVVNSSWSSAGALCEPEFDDDLRALRAAGILPVFAAGTGKPVSPADSPEAFAVGALAADGQTPYFDTAFGPSTCNGKTTIYPQMTAPGEGIYTTDRFGLYTTVDGTSLAAAHVSGTLALLLSARPSLTADEQETILKGTAVDLGQPGPDNQFGFGRVNADAAIRRALAPDPMPLMIVVLAAVLIGVVVWQRRG